MYQSLKVNNKVLNLRIEDRITGYKAQNEPDGRVAQSEYTDVVLTSFRGVGGGRTAGYCEYLTESNKTKTQMKCCHFVFFSNSTFACYYWPVAERSANGRPRPVNRKERFSEGSVKLVWTMPSVSSLSKNQRERR